MAPQLVFYRVYDSSLTESMILLRAFFYSFNIKTILEEHGKEAPKYIGEYVKSMNEACQG